MGLFKKFRENSLYWRYRFITRRSLALRRWWRTRGQVSRISTVPYRTSLASTPYGNRSYSVISWRGILCVCAIALIWSLLSVWSISAPFFVGTLRIASLICVMYLCIRFGTR